MTISFGPAHPAAHGVFRVLVTMTHENITSIAWYQGLLFRATEYLCEQRQLELVSGYYARLDYVSHFSMEWALCAAVITDTTSTCEEVLIWNHAANHLLNLSCTMADAGIVSAILWAFELREIFSELCENLFGARMHLNFAQVSAYASNTTFSTVLHTTGCELFEFLLLCAVCVRVTRQRLLFNFTLPWCVGIVEALSGPLLESAGLCETLASESLHGSETTTYMFVSGVRSCSLTRHILRTRLGMFWTTCFHRVKLTQIAKISL